MVVGRYSPSKVPPPCKDTRAEPTNPPLPSCSTPPASHSPITQAELTNSPSTSCSSPSPPHSPVTRVELTNSPSTFCSSPPPLNNDPVPRAEGTSPASTSQFTPPPRARKTSQGQHNAPVVASSRTTTYNHSPSSSVQSSASPWRPAGRTRPRSSRPLFQEMAFGYNYYMPPDLRMFLERLDERLEYLTSVVETMHRTNQPLPPLTREQSSSESISSTDLESEKTDEQPLFSSFTNPDDSQSPLPLSHDRLMILRGQANSSMNFAVRLLRELILPQELYGRNVSGTRGKQAVDPCKVEQIRTIVQKFYPAPPPCEGGRIWRECRKAMDSYLRKLPRPN